MQQKNQRFQFPEADLLHLFNEIEFSEDLQKLLMQIKNTLQYFKKQVTYHIEEQRFNEGEKQISTLKVEFTCCDPKFERPKLYFRSQDNQYYVLQNRSKFLHQHLLNSYQKQSKSISNLNSPSKFQKSNKTIENQTEKYQKINQQKQNSKIIQNNICSHQEQMLGKNIFVNENIIKQRVNICQLQRNSNNQQNFAFQENLEFQQLNFPNFQMQNQPSKGIEIQQFDFPLESELVNLQEINGIENLRIIYEKLSQESHHRNKGIQLNFQEVKSYSAAIGLRVNIQFQCCNQQYEPAFLSYISLDNKKLKLSKGYNLKHFHEKKVDLKQRQKEVMLQNQKLQNYIEQFPYQNKVVLEQIIKKKQPQIIQSSQMIPQFPIYQDKIQIQSDQIEAKQIEAKQIEGKQIEMEIQQQQSDSSIGFLIPDNYRSKSNQSSKKQNQSLNKSISIQSSQKQSKQVLINNQLLDDQKDDSVKQSELKKHQNKSKQNHLGFIPLQCNSNQIFIFPTIQQLQSINKKNKVSLRNSIQNLVNLNSSKNIKFRQQTYFSSTLEYNKIQNYKFYFYCCRGPLNKVPFLHFSSLKKSQYQLINYQVQHDHSKQGKNQYPRISRQRFNQKMKQNRTEQQTKNRIQAINLSKIYPNQIFCFPSIDFLYNMNKKSQKKIRQGIYNETYRFNSQKKTFKDQMQYNFFISSILGSTGHSLDFKFKCCKGFKNKQPFLQFSIQDDYQYYLINQSRWHDHRKQSLQKKKSNQMIILEDQSQQKQIKIKLQKQIQKNDQITQQKINNDNLIREDKQQPQIHQTIQQIQQKKQSKKAQEMELQGQIITQTKQNNQTMQNIKQKNAETTFDFPSKEQTQLLKNCNLENIQNLLNSIIEKNQNKPINYQISIPQTNQNGKGVAFFMINFTCCKINQDRKPYLHFVKRSNQKYYCLSGLYKKHKHIIEKTNDLILVNLQNENENKSNGLVQQQEKSDQMISEKNPISGDASSGKKYDEKNQNQKNQKFPSKIKQITKVVPHSLKKRTSAPQIKNTSNYQKVQISQPALKHSQMIDQTINEKNLSASLLISRQQLKSTHSSKIVQGFSINQQKMMIDQNNQQSKIAVSQQKQDKCNQKLVNRQKRQSVLSWLQTYHQHFSNFVSEKKWKKGPKSQIDSEQLTKQLFLKNFPQYEKNPDRDFQIWKQVIFEVMDLNNIEVLQFTNHKRVTQQKMRDFQFRNVIFVKKLQNQNANTGQKEFNSKKQTEIYLSIYPLNKISDSQTFKIMLAYLLNSNNQPEILWFYIYRQYESKINFLSILNENKNPDEIFQALKESIKYFQLQKVTFIYTNIDYRLMKSLDKICSLKQTPNSEQKFSSTIHFSCIKDLFQNQNIFQESKIGNMIERRIQKSSNFERISESYNFLKRLFSSNKEQKQQFINPRVVYNHYTTFREPFSNNVNKNVISEKEIEFFLKGLSISENSAEIQDSLQQLDQIFTYERQFNHIAQVFVMVIGAFDSSLRSHFKIVNKKRVVPFGLYEVRKQYRRFGSISNHSQHLINLVSEIFSQTAYQMSSVITKCPRFIIQGIYRLIITTKNLTSVDQKLLSCQKNDQKAYLYCDVEFPEKIFKVQKINKKNKNIQYSTDILKVWSCTCNFYNQTGIPCQHQIQTAIKNKDSLYKQINKCWKNSLI